jgi:hypothetical protein
MTLDKWIYCARIAGQVAFMAICKSLYFAYICGSFHILQVVALQMPLGQKCNVMIKRGEGWRHHQRKQWCSVGRRRTHVLIVGIRILGEPVSRRHIEEQRIGGR